MKIILVEFHGGPRDREEAYLTAPEYVRVVRDSEGAAHVRPTTARRGVYQRAPDLDKPDGPLIYRWIPR